MAEGIKVGELYTELVLNRDKYTKGLKDGETQTKGFAGKLSSTFKTAAVAIVASLVVVTAAVLAYAKAGIAAAEEQEKADEKTRAAFGKSSDAVIAWVNKNTVAYAVNDDVLQQSISNYKIWSDNVGIATKTGTTHAEELAKRASEIAKVSGADFETVFAALQKGEQGATRGLKGYGVAVSTAAIQDEAMRLGLIKKGEKLDDASKAAAIHSIIMRDTAKYTNLAAEADDKLSTKTKRIGVIFDEINETVGFVFVNIVSAILDVVMPAFQTLLAWVQENLPAIQKIFDDLASGVGAAFGVISAALQPVVDMFLTFVNEILIPFLQQGNNMRDLLIALGVILASVIVPAMLSLAASVVVAAAPIIALVAAVFAVIKVLDDLGLLEPIIEEATKLLGQAFDFITTNVLPALAAAFQWITENVVPALGAVFDWIVTNILPPLRSIFETFTNVILPALTQAFGAVVSWVQANLPTITKIFGQVFDAVRTIVGNIADVVKTAFEIIANVIKVVAPIIVDIGKTVFPYIGAAATILLNVIGGVFDAIGNIWNTAWDVAKAVAKGIGDAWSGLTGVITTVWNGITGIVKGGANMLIGIVNGIIGAINSIQVHIGKIGLDTPAGFVGVGPFDWDGLNLGKLKYLATGTPFFEGGWAVLGEQGPELARLPKGTQVFNAGQSRDMMGDQGRGGSGPLIGQQNIYGVQPDEVERQTTRAIRRAALTWKLEGA